MPEIIIVPSLERPQVQREQKNVFSDKTNLFLLRLLRGDSGLPETLDNKSAVQHDLQLELALAIRQRVLPWFWSTLLHVIILIVLAFILYPSIRLEMPDVLSGVAIIPFQKDVPVIAPPGNVNGNNLNGADEPHEATTVAETHSIPEVDPNPLFSGLILSGRDPDLRDTMLGGENGGGGHTDEAVLGGLRWLVKVQLPNGAWNLSGSSAPLRRDDPLAATAMALIAFQGYGVTPDSRHPMLIEFVQPVRRGWEWLLRRQNPDGSFFTPPKISNPDNHRFYTHALCTIALCERLAMTRDETLREPAQRAIDYCVRHQSLRSGGWRYLPDRFSDQSDVSVTGWVVLALKTGEAAGLTIPPETFENVTQFLDSMSRGNQYTYRLEEPELRIAMTAEALYCRVLLGLKREDRRLAAGVRSILDTPPSFEDHYQRDVYYWFFATQTLFHYGGEAWQTWNSLMLQELLPQQERNDPATAGSWSPDRPVRDKWGHQYGRLYTTCMSLYILEVYYRHQRMFP